MRRAGYKCIDSRGCAADPAERRKRSQDHYRDFGEGTGKGTSKKGREWDRAKFGEGEFGSPVDNDDGDNESDQ